MIKKIKKSLITVLILLSFSNVSIFAQGTDQRDKVPIFSVDTSEKKIALTFDINWADDDKLYEILGVLNKYDVKSTFFVIGKWVEYPEDKSQQIRDVFNAGHEIGNHSYKHPNFLQINGKQIANELGKANEIIYDITGKRCNTFRFPSGYYSSEAVQIANSMGFKSVQWSKDSLDWMNKSLESEYNRVMKDIGSGDIVLFHNNGKFTPNNLNRIIPELQKQGYKLVTVDEILYKEGFYVDKNGKQFKIS